MVDASPDQFDPNLFPAIAAFVRSHWLRISLVSILILTPCFWHREIVASDLGSHLYNAWLVQLIHRGELPGLWVAPQHTNVLFDWLLSAFGSIFGWHAAEKITVSIAVLIFFWGSFAFVSAAARRAPWFISPVIALATYGWTFHLGFFNYYLSLGLGFCAAAIFWRGVGREKLAALAFVPFIFFAHPLGVAGFVATCVFLWLHERTGAAGKLILFLLAIASLVTLHLALARFFLVTPGTRPFYSFNGADQLVLFGERYKVLARIALAFVIVAIGIDFATNRKNQWNWSKYSVPLQLYILTELAVLLMPGAVDFSVQAASIALLTERLTSVSAVLGCCLLGAMRPNKCHLAAFGAIAVVFFSFMYQDTAVVNRMEAQIVKLVSILPPNQRVMATILPPAGSRILIQHIIDRACVERCFSYANYEPAAAVFRVRASADNPYVLMSFESAIDGERGEYIVQPRDLPVYQVYQCNEDGTQLCIAPLKAGDANDYLGEHDDQ
jgi:hypothetical protein